VSSHYHPIGYRGAEQRAPQLKLFSFSPKERRKKKTTMHPRKGK
jgi:hypothetical protein